MFKKILIANRGEIALRVVRTAREMGIRTVSVYAEQDRDEQYVDMADEAYLLPGDTYRDTYLNEDLLIGILHRSGADAVHPGYGFLSEVPSFATKVREAGAAADGHQPCPAVDGPESRQGVQPQLHPVGDGDGGEGVAGADGLDRPPPVGRLGDQPSDLTDIGRRQDGDGPAGDRTAPVGPARVSPRTPAHPKFIPSPR